MWSTPRKVSIFLALCFINHYSSLNSVLPSLKSRYNYIENVWQQAALQNGWIEEWEVTAGWRIMLNNELYNLHFHQILRRQHVVYMNKKCIQSFGGKAWRDETTWDIGVEGKIILNWLVDTWCETPDGIQGPVATTIKFGFHKRRGISWLGKQVLAQWN
jgi:hypothetical protein